MSISRDGEWHDLIDGSEQPYAASDGWTVRDPRAHESRWEDDGGAPRAALLAGDTERRPAWSVLSLRSLKEALRYVRPANDPSQLPARMGRARAVAEQVRLDRATATAAARAAYYRDRNAWERN